MHQRHCARSSCPMNAAIALVNTTAKGLKSIDRAVAVAGSSRAPVCLLSLEMIFLCNCFQWA